jgi:hypothetical protein
MKRSRILYEKDIKDHKDKSGEDVKLGVYGVFDTNAVRWKYYLISFYVKSNNITMTEDLCVCSSLLNPSSAQSYSKEIESVDEGVKFIDEYKSKWEHGSNDPRDKIRDEKIDEILDPSN